MISYHSEADAKVLFNYIFQKFIYFCCKMFDFMCFVKYHFGFFVLIIGEEVAGCSSGWGGGWGAGRLV